jgi:deoxycytidylate deaminase
MKQFAIRHAIKAASESTYEKYYHGCSIESGGRLISTGCNDKKIKHPKLNEFSTHAELAALKKAGKHAIGAKLYVVRLAAGDNAKLANSKPCARCQIAIMAAGIKKVFYSIAHNEWGVWTV